MTQQARAGRSKEYLQYPVNTTYNKTNNHFRANKEAAFLESNHKFSMEEQGSAKLEKGFLWSKEGNGVETCFIYTSSCVGLYYEDQTNLKMFSWWLMCDQKINCFDKNGFLT